MKNRYYRNWYWAIQLRFSCSFVSSSRNQKRILERKPEFRWHEGLLLQGTTLQVPFFADLVTMANPCHPLGYINYLHQHDRLHQFYYYDSFNSTP